MQSICFHCGGSRRQGYQWQAADAGDHAHRAAPALFLFCGEPADDGGAGKLYVRKQQKTICMSRVIISVKDLVKNYGSFQAVKGISFDVLQGEIFGLLGPNGAGKSTTLEIIETLREKTSGTIIVDGLDLDRQPNDIKKIIGVQLQCSGFYTNLNFVEMIDLFSGLYKQKVDAMSLLEMVNLKDKAKAKVKEL